MWQTHCIKFIFRHSRPRLPRVVTSLLPLVSRHKPLVVRIGQIKARGNVTRLSLHISKLPRTLSAAAASQDSFLPPRSQTASGVPYGLWLPADRQGQLLLRQLLGAAF
jgi:hypothetical protein